MAELVWAPLYVGIMLMSAYIILDAVRDPRNRGQPPHRWAAFIVMMSTGFIAGAWGLWDLFV